MTSAEEAVLVRKMAWKVLPFLLVAYLICIIDRLNVGLAALSMNAELGFTATVYGWGAGLFFVGLLHRVRCPAISSSPGSVPASGSRASCSRGASSRSRWDS